MEKLSHAYIVSSASEKQRTEIARELAAKMMCRVGGDKPCGVCRDCRKIKNNVHPDLITVSRPLDDSGNKKREIAVDQIRDMSADAYVLPNEAKTKVYIIEEADTMNIPAQNAALKLFEEPPQNVAFILCVENMEKLLITVRSRCVAIKKNAEENAPSEEAMKMAKDYLAAVKSGDKLKLLEFCVANENSDSRKTAEFIAAAKGLLVKELATEHDAKSKKQLMDKIDVLDKCTYYMRVNTGIKHIYGLLSVS